MIYILVAIIIPIILMSLVAYCYGRHMFERGYCCGVAMCFQWVESFTGCKDARDIYNSHVDEFPDDAIMIVIPEKGEKVKATGKHLYFPKR